MNTDLCIICCKKLTESTGVKKPTLQGYATIFSAAEKRRDEASLRILSQQNEINKKPENFKFHSSCRKSFCSKNNIDKIIKSKQNVTNDPCCSTSSDRVSDKLYTN